MLVELQEVIVGSHLHGLATPESDVDKAVVYIEDTIKLVGVPLPKARQNIGTQVDTTWFEVGKIVDLVRGGNPTAIEALYSPMIERVDTNHPYLQEKFQDIKRELWPLVQEHKILYSAIGYAESCIKQASQLARVKKNHRAAVRVLNNALVSVTTGEPYFGGGSGLDGSWATIGALTDRYYELRSKAQDMAKFRETSETPDFNPIHDLLSDMRRYCV